MRRLLLSAVVIVSVAAPAAARDTVGAFDPTNAMWHIRMEDGTTRDFEFGNPGDRPLMGDWNCDGVDTPGLYRQRDGYVYLRNANSTGTADISYFFGDPGDVPIAGDFDRNGCDTVSLYRPEQQRFFVIDTLGSHDTGLGAASLDFVFGDPGDQPFAGDFDGDGRDTFGLYRERTGFVYYRNSLAAGIADALFFFGDPGDRFVAGDWTGDGTDTVGVYR